MARSARIPRSISALTVAGIDPTGTAGMVVDLNTFAAFGVNGLAVTTVVTAQNTADFVVAVPIDAAVVSEQIRTLVDDIVPAASKLSMLWSREIAEVMVSMLDLVPNVVIDPVLIDGFGALIVESAVIDVYRDRLIPRATVVTPNRAEAGLLLDREVVSVDDATSAAVALVQLGAECAVVTGGGVVDDDAGVITDVIAVDGVVNSVRHRRLSMSNVRGSGDTLSAAITATLATGSVPAAAVAAGQRFVTGAIAAGLADPIGRGRSSARQLGAAVDPKTSN